MYRKLLIGLLCSYSISAVAQERPVGPPLPIVLHHADSFSGRQSDSGEVQELTGNVWLQQGNAVLRCGSAIQYLQTGFIILRHNVRIEQGDLRITAPVITYDPTIGMAKAERGAEVTQRHRTIRSQWAAYDIPRQELLFFTGVSYADDTVRLWTDSLRYFRRTEQAQAWGGLYVESLFHRVKAEADSFLYSPAEGWLLLSGNALLQQWNGTDSSASSRWLSAATVVLSQRSGVTQLTASGSATLFQDTLLAAQAERLLWERSPEVLVLGGNPVLWYGTAEMIGDSVYATMNTGQLRALSLFGQARLRIHTPFPARTHQLQADSILLQQEADSLTTLIASGNARSLYCHRSADGMPEGLFRHSADRIELSFLHDSLLQARWLGSVYGEYAPESLVAERFSEWSLPGMAWQHERPQRPRWRHRHRWLP